MVADLEDHPNKAGDTTGCGDNFVGGVLSSLAVQREEQGQALIPDLERAVAEGVCAGGLALYSTGGTFRENVPGEKALLLSVSYDFDEIGWTGLSAILNAVAAFDADTAVSRGSAQEIDLTLDYRPQRGPLRNFWLRLRGSWLHEQSAGKDGAEVRVIFRYDLPAI